MSSVSDVQSTTVLGAVITALREAATYNPDVQVRPAAVLWSDHDRQWEKLSPMLRQVMPEFLIFGEYNAEFRTGPAIWLKCMLAAALSGKAWPDDVVPVIYLPGVSRQELRAVEDCPKDLQPLAELQYRGVLWSQTNGRDWSLYAFLKARDGGLGLDVAKDSTTQEAMLRAMVQLADTSMTKLRGRRLEASDFDQLLTTDPVRDLLRWMNDPDGTRRQWGEEVWGAFCAVCTSEFGLDPEAEGELVGAEKFGLREGAWAGVWARFEEAPELYPNLPDLLRRAEPSDLVLFDDRSSWPSENERAEAALEEVLAGLEGRPESEARDKILALEKEHGERRQWVWTKIGKSELVQALEHLAAMAEATGQKLTGETGAELAEAYSTNGWYVDDAVLRALAAVTRADGVAAVMGAIRAAYMPWAESHARRTQDLLTTASDAPRAGAVTGGEGEVVFFADGLRFDIGQRLAAELTTRNLEVDVSYRWAGHPTVTATCKPYSSPVADGVAGSSDDEEFQPHVADNGGSLTTHRFRKLIEANGYQVLTAEGMGDRSGRGWVEAGKLDHIGHEQGWKLARRIDEEVRELADRIENLLVWGWHAVKVVTDHGWLLMPGGLPKTDLPSYLVETRWGRCGLLKTTTTSTLPSLPWSWDAGVDVAFAPGISCFKAGMEYAHGGVSLQECVTPILRVRSGTAPVAAVTISSVTWRGLRCRIEVAGGGEGLTADLRTKPAQSDSSVAATTKEIAADSTVSLVVEDDSLEGMAAVAVILDASGTLVAKEMTTVGEED